MKLTSCSFNLPVLKYRAKLHGVSVPWLYGVGDNWNSHQSRYSTDWHCDLLDVLSDYGASARVSLHQVSAVLVDEGQIEDVRHYCETD